MAVIGQPLFRRCFFKMKDKKICKVTMPDGRKCKRASIFDGYCLIHFVQIRDRLNKKKKERQEKKEAPHL